MTPEEIAAKEAADKAAADAEAKATADAEAAEQNLHNKRTDKEKAEFNLRKKADEARALGIDPAELLGIKPQITVDESLSDDTPLTVGKLKDFQKQEAKKTALDMAETIEDEAEREEVKTILADRLKPSGNAQADLDLARAAANAKRTAQIAEEVNRKSSAGRNAAGGSGNGKHEEQFVPTEQESVFMGPPYNLSKEKILETRRKAEESRK